MSQRLTAEQIERIFIDLKEFAWDMFRVSPDDSIRNLTKAEAHSILDELCRRSLQIPEAPTGRVPSSEEMILDMDVDDIKDAIGKAYPSLDDMTRGLLCDKVDRIHELAYRAMLASR